MLFQWLHVERFTKNAIALLFIVLFVGAIVSCITGGIASTSWPSVAGTITRSELYTSFEDQSTSPYVTYVFTVSDRQYTGGRVSFGFSSRVLERYHVGQTVQVYYSPENPERSVLEPGFGIDRLTPLAKILLLALAIALLGIIIALGRILTPKKRPQQDL